MARTRQPGTYPKPAGGAWMTFKAQVFRIYGDTCHLCGHHGAAQVDHVIPVSIRPDLAWDISNCRPAHGAPRNRCPVCGVGCNQSRHVKPAGPIIAAAAAARGRRCGPACRTWHTTPGRCW